MNIVAEVYVVATFFGPRVVVTPIAVVPTRHFQLSVTFLGELITGTYFSGYYHRTTKLHFNNLWLRIQQTLLFIVSQWRLKSVIVIGK